MKIEEAVNGQKVWGWKVAVHLFLAGVGTGAYLVGFTANLTHPEMVIITKVSVLLSAPLVIIGLLFLITDLGRKPRAFLAFSQPGSSWIARGIVIITVFVILDLIYLAVWIWPFTLLEGIPNLHLALESAVAIFALLTLIYTGMVLGVTKPIAFWNSMVLPWLFLISSISIGIMGVALSISVYALLADLIIEQPIMLLSRYNTFVIIIEALIICLYLLRIHQVRAARISVHMLTKGILARHFWVGVVVTGLIVPFAFALYVTYMSAAEFTLILTILSSLIGLAGGFMLRYIIVVGGASMPLNINGIIFPVPKTTGTAVSQPITY